MNSSTKGNVSLVLQLCKLEIFNLPTIQMKTDFFFVYSIYSFIFTLIRTILSLPSMNGCKTSGIEISFFSALKFCSINATITLGTAIHVPLSVETCLRRPS